MAAGALIARIDHGATHQTQVGHEEGVIGMRWTSRLPRVVGDHSAFLLAVDQLDGGEDAQDPRCIEQGHHALIRARARPGDYFAFGRRRQRTAQSVLADHFVHAQQPRIRAFAANHGDVRVALVVRQNRRQSGTQYIRLCSVRSG